jgi:CheY-like chemotaxis protein
MIQCLVVDQNAEERETVSQLLNTYGFKLTLAPHADEALKQCRSSAPDVIVLADRIGMERREFIKRSQRACRGKKPVVLVCTSDGNADAMGRAILDGAAECLVQPFDREILEFKLRQVGLIS